MQPKRPFTCAPVCLSQAQLVPSMLPVSAYQLHLTFA